MIELDIPQLSSSGIQFKDRSFGYTYSIQSSSTHSLLSSSFDAPGLEYYLSYGDKTPSSTSHIVKNRTELDSIPLNVEDLWIQPFDTSELIEYSFNSFQSLQSLVIGKCLFWRVTRFEFTNLSQLQSITLGDIALHLVHSIVFESDGMDGIMIQICLNYNPFNLDTSLLMATIVLIEKRLTSIPITTRTH